MSISKELEILLRQKGAVLVGFADLSNAIDGEMHYGICVGINLKPHIIYSIEEGPNMDYYNEYYSVNEKLDEIVEIGAKFLKEKGYNAWAKTRNVVKEYDVYRTELPHKTVATNAGLGWIGKSALFVTEQFGSAVRISSIVTDAPLQCGIPITESRCGECRVCVDACPGQAISGKRWSVEVDRDEFYDALKCRKKARELSKSIMNKEITLCGKCIEVCPYTKAYLRKEIN